MIAAFRPHNGVAVPMNDGPAIPGEAMETADPDLGTLKRAMKEALAETLHEPRALLDEGFAEVLEDFALAETIREGQPSEVVWREEVFGLPRGIPIP